MKLYSQRCPKVFVLWQFYCLVETSRILLFSNMIDNGHMDIIYIYKFRGKSIK